MNSTTINIATKRYDESEGGLLLCGVNWGGDPSAAQDQEAPSFFSDRSVNNYPYRNRLVRWFGLLGHPLATEAGTEGKFERSIVQTNWLYGQAVHMRGTDLVGLCARENEAFLFHLRTFRPRLVVLVSIALFDALNQPSCLEAVSSVLGEPSPPRVLTKEIVENGKRFKRFRFGIQQFARSTVIALPHPTGSMGLHDAYVAAFEPEIGPEISRYRSMLGG